MLMALTAWVCSYARSSSAVSLMFLHNIDDMEEASDMRSMILPDMTAAKHSNAIAVILVRKTMDFDVPTSVVSIPDTSDIIRMLDTNDPINSASAVLLTPFTSWDMLFISSFDTDTISSLEASDRNNPYFLLNLPILTIEIRRTYRTCSINYHTMKTMVSVIISPVNRGIFPHRKRYASIIGTIGIRQHFCPEKYDFRRKTFNFEYSTLNILGNLKYV